MSQNGLSTEAVLAAAFGQSAVDTAAPAHTGAQTAAPDDGVPNLLVDLDAPAAQPAQAPARVAETPSPVADAASDLQARLLEAERDRAYLRGLLESQRAEAAPAQQAPVQQAPAYDPARDALTPEELVAYQESLPVIEKLARQAAYRAQHSIQEKLDTLQQHNQALQQRLDAVHGQAARADEVALMHTVRSQVQDADQVTKTAEWKRYLNARAPFSGGRSVREVLEHAVQSRDADTITEHLMAFKASHNISAPPAAVPAPGRTAAPAAVGIDLPQRKTGISASALDEAMARVQAGTLSKDAYDKMLAQVFGAAASGSELVQ